MEETMALTKSQKSSIIKKFQTSPTDTGSPEVQIAVLTAEINELNIHLTSHIHDFSSKRGLYVKIGQRRNLINYLKGVDFERYSKLIKDLGLRK
jgi:small subunit ribosomal protein S15